MNRIKRFIDAFVPVTTCNMSCPYCYVTQMNLSRKEIPEFEYSPEYMAKCLSKRRLGGSCAINLCGHGETLLPKELTGIIDSLLGEGHFIFVVTNGTVNKRFDEIIKLSPRRLKRLFIKFSLHYLELLRFGGGVLMTFFQI
jgi:wyosine [tRNA(Phe)-imidazoG37] synthetase (radical SAM superfamily)